MSRSLHPLACTALVWLLGAVMAWAQVRVTPGAVVLLPGESCAFKAVPLPSKPRLTADCHSCEGCRARAGAGPVTRWSLAGDVVGSLDPKTGLYTAPEVADPALVRIRVETLAGSGEASLLVLPRQPFALVAKVLGQDWLQPFCRRLPFLDPASGLRAAGNPRLLEMPDLAMTSCLAGYGLPATLSWPARTDSLGQMLSYLEGGQLLRKEVTGQQSQEILARGRIRSCVVESLHPRWGHAGGFSSTLMHLPVRVQGLLPLAGNALDEPGHRDGQGAGARLREPFGLARIRDGKGPGLLVADAGSHVLRLVDEQGEVRTLAGQPGTPGHRDRARAARSWRSLLSFNLCRKPGEDLGPPALFNGPTFVLAEAVPQPGEPTWEAVLADTGNHVLRVLHPDGSVGTLAGLPGVAGHQDAADPEAARFREPMGLARGPGGQLFIADRGNRVIRRIDPSGRVSTIAGSPGLAGTQDGTGDQARFTDPKGLAISPASMEPPWLAISDGHAVRLMNLSTGRVSTLVGRIGEPAFRERAEGDPGQVPCLNDPCGLCWRGDRLLIADRGNHAVRLLDIHSGSLVTLAGDPECGQSRPGLLRLGLEGPLDERFAALDGPRALLALPSEGPAQTFVVASGRVLDELCLDPTHRDRLAMPLRLECPERLGAGPCRVRFRVEAVDPVGQPALRKLHYRVRFLHPDGSEAQACAGEAESGAAIAAEGSFTQRGACQVLVQCVSDQGVPAGIRQTVTVD